MVKKAAHATPNHLLRAARQERGWSQQQVADSIGAPLSLNVSRWETGTTFPSAYYVEKLCQLFGKSVRELGLSQIADEAQGHRSSLQPKPASQMSSEPVPETRCQEATKYSISSRDLAKPSHFRPQIVTSLPAEQQDDLSPHAVPKLWALPSPHNPRRSPFPRTNLPVQLTPLVGREREVETASTLLRSPQIRLLTLVGPAGVGKTSLALRVAAELLEAFADGVSFVPLATMSDPQFLVSALAQSIGLTQRGSQPLLDMLKTTLQEKHLLLLLDNFEQIVIAAPLLSELLSTCCTLKILVTSREVLRLHGEQSFMVSPLALPDLHELPGTEELVHYAAIDLFVQRVQAFKLDFQLTESNARVISEICTRLDGLPLALELAAARLKVLSPQALLAGLEYRLHVLTMGARDLPERHQTLRKTIEWSYNLLNSPEQQLFRRLSIFVGGCTFEALAALSTTIGDRTDQILDTITALIDKSLVQQGESVAGEPRFTMLETIHEYSLERLIESGEHALVRQAHAFYYLALAEEAKPFLRGARQAIWMARLEQEMENLRAAMHWSLEQAESGQNMEIALRLGDALEQFWMTRGPYSEGRLFLERALATSEGVAPMVRARALIATANLVNMQGNYTQGEALAQASLELCQQLGDKLGIARSLFQVGKAAYMKGNLGTARACMEKSVEVRREMDDKRWLAVGLRSLAEVISVQGEYIRAADLYEESVQILRALGWMEAMAQSLLPWAWTMFLSQGELAVVESKIEKGLAIARDLDSKETIADFFQLAGRVTLNQEDATNARLLVEESLALYRRVGASEGIAGSLLLLGKIMMSQGDLAAAYALYKEYLTLEGTMDKRLNMPPCLEGLADTVAAQGNGLWAARLWGAAAAQRDALGMPLPPVDRVAYERSVAAACAQLGEQAFTKAWVEGRNMTPEEVLHAQRPAMMLISVPISSSLSPSEKSSPSYPDGLSAREVEVLRLVAQGLSNVEIAEYLSISLLTVKAHMRSIYNKLAISSRVAATHYAIEHHLL